MPWGAIASAVGNIAGGLIGQNKSEGFQSDMADRAAQVQREFAENGVRWRVADAQAAGIHPLFALGAQLPTYQPPAVFGSESFGQGLANAGQDIGRAIDSTRTAGERVQARMDALRLENAGLQNDFLRAQIAKLNQQSGPPLPGSAYMVEGQSSSPVVGGALVSNQPMERTVPSPVAPGQEPGAVVDLGFAKTPTGLAPVPSEDVKKRIEDTLIPEAMWSLRNLLLPNVDFSAGRAGMKPPHSALPAGATHWRWNFLRQEWQAHFPSRDEDVTGRVIRLP